MRKEKQQRRDVVLVRDPLYIDGELYSPPAKSTSERKIVFDSSPYQSHPVPNPYKTRGRPVKQAQQDPRQEDTVRKDSHRTNTYDKKIQSDTVRKDSQGELSLCKIFGQSFVNKPNNYVGCSTVGHNKTLCDNSVVSDYFYVQEDEYSITSEESIASPGDSKVASETPLLIILSLSCCGINTILNLNLLFVDMIYMKYVLLKLKRMTEMI